jgi:hypothetical protein
MRLLITEREMRAGEMKTTLREGWRGEGWGVTARHTA